MSHGQEEIRAPKLRVARPTDNLDALLPFYRDGLGLEVLAQFEDHAGFDGIVMGRRDAPYHLEFTCRQSQTVGRAPSDDNLLVLYLPDPVEWQGAVNRLTRAGFPPITSANPYWDEFGLTFEDPDGYRLVLQRAAWTR